MKYEIIFKCLQCLQFLFFACITLLGLSLTLVLFHCLKPIEDPLHVSGPLDKLSLIFGAHDQIQIVILEIREGSTEIYTYIYQRQISDGSFFISNEFKEFLYQDEWNSTVNILRGIFRHDVGSESKIPILIRLRHSFPELKTLTKALLNQTRLLYDSSHSIGHLRKEDETSLQWFTLNLLSGVFSKKNFAYTDTPVLFNVENENVEITFALGSEKEKKKYVGSKAFTNIVSLRVYHQRIDLATLTLPSAGLLSGRKFIYGNGTNVRSPCVNPIVDTIWNYKNQNLRIRGLQKPNYETVKTRNGPFAGKKVKRPIANFNSCQSLVSKVINEKFPKGNAYFVRKKGSQETVFMKGVLLEKTLERGLLLPTLNSKSSVSLKSFIESVKHACKVPNTEQPFACTDLMYLKILLEKLLIFKSGSSSLHSTLYVKGMTGNWPLAASFYIYNNGLHL